MTSRESGNSPRYRDLTLRNAASETRHILPQHRVLLDASGIASEVAAARGYRSVETKAELRRLGFADTQCRVPALLVPIWSVTGEKITYQIRPDEPRIKDGKPLKYETPRGTHMTLDAPPGARAWLKDPTRPLFITEGVRKADAAVSRDLCCIALLGVWNWRGTNEHGGKVALGDWEQIALNERRAYICFDTDVMTKPAVHQAMTRLKAFLETRGAQVYLIYLPAGDGGTKVGLDDYLAAGHGVQDLLGLASPELKTAPDEKHDDGCNPSQADRLVRLVLADGVQLFHDPLGDGLARVRVRDHWEILRCRNRDFKRWLAHLLWKAEGKAPNSDALNAALTVIEAQARFEGEEHVLHNRVAFREGAIWYDLTDAEWRAVRITLAGWEVVAEPPILFRRHSHQRPQVLPIAGGDLRDLLGFVNLQDVSHQLLVLVHLVSCLVPEIPHPIPVLHGAQGAAKTSLLRMERRLVDPSAIEVLSLPRDVTELVQQLSHHWAPFYDNVGDLPGWVSDAFCRAVTGEGFTKRELYSDDDDVIYEFRRCVGLNGINVAAHRSDLLDRCILLGLEPIAEDDRQPEKELWSAFEAVRPRLLGAAFDILSRAMALRPGIVLAGLPRMADFALWGCAIAEALGYSQAEFTAAYDLNADARNDEVLQGSPVAATVAALMEGRETWQGTPSELYAELEPVAGVQKVDLRSKAWPKAPHTLMRKLNEVRPNLAAAGIRFEAGREGRQRWLVIRKGQDNSVTSVGSVTGGQATLDLCPVSDDATSDGDDEASP